MKKAHNFVILERYSTIRIIIDINNYDSRIMWEVNIRCYHCYCKFTDRGYPFITRSWYFTKKKKKNYKNINQPVPLIIYNNANVAINNKNNNIILRCSIFGNFNN